ncbi:hypothetical protein L249_6319 [Ophiocordyceps polyrhachis-furcata BCC 54312]|uniref:SP-RING-type domain-containing protein n=1 Tax=Ophiocordyceps polyrhachis-furcata BCC 54312 TaxID=1330021 RepID=A0A367L135_9HYPO|nr:hypothetical protein L249_6319 [Ophiocordyceps polyrhachis-furcata BCC 54312]
MPGQKRRSRPEAAHEEARPHLDASNETSFAFLGMQRRAWMTNAGSAAPAVAHPKSCAQSRRQNPSPVISCAPAASTLPSGTTVFPSPVNSSVSSPETSTSGPSATGSPSAATAPPPQPPLPASADPVSASQAPSPPSCDFPFARLPQDAHAPSASVQGFQPAGQTTGARFILTTSGSVASGSEHLPATTATCVPQQRNPSSPSENPVTPQDESASVLRPTQQNMTAAGNNSTSNNGPASNPMPTQSNVPSAAESLTTPPRELTSTLMSTNSNGPPAAASLVTPRHKPDSCPVIYQQGKAPTADNRSTHLNDAALPLVSTQQNLTSPTENHLTRYNWPAPSLLPVSSNAPYTVTNQPTPHNQPASMEGALPAELSDRQQKRHCSSISRQPAVSSPVHGNFNINFHHLAFVVETRLRHSEGVGLRGHHTLFYRMLGSACSLRDLFYLVFHQAFCLWSLNNSSAYQFLGASPQVVDSAFNILLRIWRQNSELPLPHLQWFAAFPVCNSSTNFLGSPLLSRDLVSGIMPLINTFLEMLALNYGLVLVQVVERGYPLMAYEIRYVLQCPSLILRWVLFTCSRRSLGIHDDSSAQKMLSHLFQMDSKSEDSQSAETPNLKQARLEIMNSYLAVTQRGTGLPPNHTSAAVNHTQSSTQQHLGTHNAHLAQQHLLRPPTLQSSRPLQSASPANFAPHNMSSYPLATHGPVMDSNVNVGVAQDLANAGQMPTGLTQPHLAPFGFSGSPSSANRGFQQASPHVAQARTTSLSTRAPMIPAVQHPTPLVQNRVAQRTLPASVSPTHGPGPPHPQQQIVHHAIPHTTTWPHPSHASRVVQPRPNPRPAATPGQLSQHQVVQLNEQEIPRDDWSRAQNSLHLSYLRSPERTCAMPTRKRFYQFISELAAAPQAFLPQTGLRALRFSVSQSQLSMLVVTGSSTEMPKVLFSNGSLRYRLRMCKLSQTQSTQQVKESTWTGYLSFWLPHIFLACNGQHVQPRRRQHFGSDLPVELTGLLKPGENTVQVSLPRVEGNTNQHWTYFMAVEIISILDHDAVRAMVQANSRTSVEEFKRDVNRRLRPDGSDDIIAESDNICVSVADPFSSSLFTIPVRGVDCKHLECFDLEIWLRTRPAKTSREPSAVDCWKCPICDSDARPVSLHVDDFFAEVRAKLVKDGEGSVKKVNIHSDGTWSPLLEADEPHDEAQVPTAPGRERPAGTPAAVSELLQEVITIEDD